MPRVKRLVLNITMYVRHDAMRKIIKRKDPRKRKGQRVKDKDKLFPFLLTDREHAFSQEQKGLRQVRTSGQGVSFHDFLERKFGKVVFSKKKKIIPGYSGATLNDTSLEVEDAFGLILQEVSEFT